jgi:enterochelin esterase family protein
MGQSSLAPLSQWIVRLKAAAVSTWSSPVAGQADILLVPDLEAELPLVAAPHGRALMGASFGAVAALSVAHRYPGTYGRLLLQSGSFARSDGHCATREGSLWQPVIEFVDRFVAAPVAASERVYACCGVYETLICENRALLPTLTSTGMDVWMVEALDGHNWVSWRDRLGEALRWLFPTG